jgi:anaerobic selenocysteine-containing dehydrogenase
MNGQPTAQNTRECGADGDLTGFRNWNNDAHVADLARHWSVDPMQIPHMAPPTHAMQMFRYAEQGSIQLLWVSGTNPAVSMPELSRIRSILSQERLFLVVQDIFLTETAQLADVVLPAATWGEKSGAFTNADRTVHLSEKAVDPPGAARPDLEIFLDYARRMGFRDKDGHPFPQWHDAESAFDAWAACSAEHPDGTERVYADGRFWSAPDDCESYGRDLLTGAPLEETEYRALNPQAKAVLKAAEYVPAHERPDDEHPFALITGRTIYHFHTRTKTGRAPQLQAAAPEVWVQCAAADARRLGIAEGDLADVTTPRGAIRARVRIGGIREGCLFVPFHYGYWDTTGSGPGDQHGRAANELTMTDWDPASKQPLFKTAAARLTRVVDDDERTAPPAASPGTRSRDAGGAP